MLKILYNQIGHRWQYNDAQERCDLHAMWLRQENRHMLIIFNTYCFSMAMCLNVMLYIAYLVNLDIRWRWVAILIPHPRYPWENGCSCPLNRLLGGSQSWSGWCVNEKILLPLPGITLWFLSCLACIVVSVLTKLLWPLLLQLPFFVWLIIYLPIKD